jgi:hypothetical protein
MRSYCVEALQNAKRIARLDNIFIMCNDVNGTTELNIMRDESILFQITNFNHIQKELKDYLVSIDNDHYISKRGKIYIYNESSELFKMYNHSFIPVAPMFDQLDWCSMVSKTKEFQNCLIEEEEI